MTVKPSVPQYLDEFYLKLESELDVTLCPVPYLNFPRFLNLYCAGQFVFVYSSIGILSFFVSISIFI